ncbi:MAG: hypothetical protein SGJ27_02385 [Candidatus Melainabacteria bacterium]|nr:hypothetical protein [Candidatus Melainabacteria bacterium]
MEPETQNSLDLSVDTLPSSEDVSSSDSLAATAKTSKKKGKKKSEGGSDIAFIVCFPALVIAVVTIVLSIVGFLPNMWLAELFASLRAQFIIILLLCILPALFVPQLRLPMLISCVLFAAVNAAFVVPPMIPKPPPSKDLEGLTLVNFRIMQLGIEDPETKLEPIVQQISNSRANVVCVTGIPNRSLIKLNEIMPSQYLHRAFYNRDDGYAQAIYSDVPLKGSVQKKVGPEKLPVVCTSIHFDYAWFRVIMVKLPEPTNDATLAKRNEQLTAVAQVVKSFDGRKIVLGNFNTTPYSMAFSPFLKDTELIDTRDGVQPNYSLLGPVDVPGLSRVPADHILINKRVGLLHRYVFPTEGLTHQPLLADLYPGDRDAVLYQEASEKEVEEDAAPAAAEPAPEKPAADEKKPGKRKKRSK